LKTKPPVKKKPDDTEDTNEPKPKKKRPPPKKKIPATEPNTDEMKADKLLDGKELKSTLDDVSNDPTSDPMEVTTTDDKKLDASYKCNFRKKLIVGGRSATRGNKEEVKKIKEDYMAKKREKKAEEKKERDE